MMIIYIVNTTKMTKLVRTVKRVTVRLMHLASPMLNLLYRTHKVMKLNNKIIHQELIMSCNGMNKTYLVIFLS